jgi:hypothetical protein
MNSKTQLLQHYAEREPKAFIQFDGFDAPGDCWSDPKTGLGLFKKGTSELMNGADVRILIDPQTHRKKVLQILHELVAWIEGDEDALVFDDAQIWVTELLSIASYRGESYELNSEDDIEALRQLQRHDLELKEKHDDAADHGQ